MASASSLAHFNSSNSDERGLETIEIDPQYAQDLGFFQGDTVRSSECREKLFTPLICDDKVEIGLLHDLQIAKSVGTEPLTADDWEILVCET